MLRKATRSTRKKKRFAFTLVELLIVVVILGVLAAVITTAFANAGVEAGQKAFATNIKTLASACELYRVQNGVWPADSTSGELPPEMVPYIKSHQWETPTPIGGVWDIEFEEAGVTAAIGVHFDGTGQTQDDEFMEMVDAIFDNGALDSGSFQKLADARYYYILEP